MTKPNGSFFGDEGLYGAVRDLSIKALDVGARGGFLADLAPIAAGVDAIGFEPDAEECDRLNTQIGRHSFPWKSIRFLPIALGKIEESRNLYLYGERGCSSLLQANIELAKQFAREDYFRLDRTVRVQTLPLDLAAERFGFQDAVFMKLDTQGTEHEILCSGSKLVSDSLLALRVEVEFSPQYRDQPLFADVDSHLRSRGMVPVELRELSEWRRSTKVKHPHVKGGAIPYSRGQLIHGDVIYFKDPERLDGTAERDVLAQLRAAFLAAALEHIDHAAFLLRREAVRQYVRSRFGLNVMDSLDTVSRTLGRMNRRKRWHQVAREIGALVRMRI